MCVDNIRRRSDRTSNIRDLTRKFDLSWISPVFFQKLELSRLNPVFFSKSWVEPAQPKFFPKFKLSRLNPFYGQA